MTRWLVRMLVYDANKWAQQIADIGRDAGWEVAGPRAARMAFTSKELSEADLVLISAHGGLPNDCPDAEWNFSAHPGNWTHPTQLLGNEPLNGVLISLACDNHVRSENTAHDDRIKQWPAAEAWRQVAGSGSIFTGYGSVGHQYAVELVKRVQESLTHTTENDIESAVLPALSADYSDVEQADKTLPVAMNNRILRVR